MTAGHILTVARTLAGGGERVQLRLAAEWIAAGRRVTLLVGEAQGPLAAELPPGLELIELHDRRYVALAMRLPGIIRSAAPDILFCPGNYYTSAAAWAKLRLGRHCPPIVGKMSNAPDRRDLGVVARAAHRGWLAVHGRFLDRLVAMTPATAALAADLLRMERRVAVIPNPPALRRVDVAPPPLPDGRFVLGVGRLVAQKRWDRLIAALPALPTDTALVILGEGHLRTRLGRLAAALGVGGRVHLPGHAADPFTAMARAIVVALTSDYEGVPGVLCEALSVGTPVVTTASSAAIAEIVTAPTLGSIVPRDDPPALAAALTHWLDAPRPAPVPQPGADAAGRYLALFDALV